MPHFYGTTHSRERRDSRVLRPLPRREPTHEEIALQAYYYWQARGCPHGSSEYDWLRAERDLRERLDPFYW